MVLNTTFNNISVISWRSVLLVEETGVPGENHRPVAIHWQTLSHSGVHLALVQHYVIKFVSDLRLIGGFLRVLRFPPPRYIWNIVESGVKHHQASIADVCVSPDNTLVSSIIDMQQIKSVYFHDISIINGVFDRSFRLAY